MTNPEKRLVIVNSAKWPEDFTTNGIYSCPSRERGFNRSYFHYPAHFFGVYVNKGVPYIADVAACVRLNTSSSDEVLWQFCDDTPASLTNLAREKLAATGYHNRPPCLVFLLANQTPTSIEYDGVRGMWSSCVYFDLSDIRFDCIAALGDALKGQIWSLLPKWNRKT